MVRLRRVACRFVCKALGYFQQVRVGDKWVAISFYLIVINILHVLVRCRCHRAIFVGEVALTCVLLPFFSFTNSCIQELIFIWLTAKIEVVRFTLIIGFWGFGDAFAVLKRWLVGFKWIFRGLLSLFVSFTVFDFYFLSGHFIFFEIRRQFKWKHGCGLLDRWPIRVLL